MAQGIFTLKQVNQAIRQGAWSAFNPPQFVEYLCVAGGGSGAGNRGLGGGGGAGGLLTGMVPVVAGTSYTVTIGAGGVDSASANGGVGGNSVFGTISASGGGTGGEGGQNGYPGGSGGGGAYNNKLGGSGIFGQGNAGGVGWNGNSPYGSGGGGGAGTVGLKGGGAGEGGNGGAGIASVISGTVTAYAGGGGGGAYGTVQGTGGLGGGGAASNISSIPTPGTANTGGGGGSDGRQIQGGNGGSGIVIVRYPGNVQFYTGGAVTYANGHVVHTFYVTDTLAPTTPTALATSEYQISRSLRFNMADPAYLKRTPTVAGNRKTWTLSVWLKRAEFKTTNQPSGILTAVAAGATTWIYLRSEYGGGLSKIDFYDDTVGYVTTDAAYRDVSAWYHFVFVMDTTNASVSQRMRIYVNGVLQTTSANSPPVLNADSSVNTTNAHWHGVFANETTTNSLGAYLAEMNFIDGQALTPSSFGETNSNTGVWGPKAYTGTYGTNGYYLNFSDNTNTTAATLGKDYSGNGNNWTPNNFSVTAGVGNDSLLDTPTPYGTDTGVGGEVRGNYCTLNPLGIAGAVSSNGNLSINASSASGNRISTFLLTSGKWYWEGKGEGYVGAIVGIGGEGFTTTLSSNGSKSIGYWWADGFAYGDTFYSSAGAVTYTSSDTIGIALDMDMGNVRFYKNNTLIHNLTFGNAGTSGYVPSLSAGVYPGYNAASGTYNADFNFGQRPFTYTAPSGYKAICTTNLPTPAIGSSPTSLASKFFNTVLWTGDGSQTRSITGVGFQPDFTWMKIRAGTPQDHQLYDAVRGAGGGKNLSTNTTAAEGTVGGYLDSDYGYLSSFDSDGFSVNDGAVATTGGYVNYSGRTYVGWNWKASNATAVNNTSGSLTSQVRANLVAGFSVVTYTGNSGADQTVGHGLGVVPSWIIAKQRTGAGTNWVIYHKSLGVGKVMIFTDSGAISVAGYWGAANISSTVFGVKGGGYDNNTNGASMVAYCFAPIEGYSAFGSYVGNGSADGPFVHTGFRPAFILLKVSDGTASWLIHDNKRNTNNVVDKKLFPNLSDVEATADVADFLSNGFKLRGTNTQFNGNGYNYIFAAFAENPFKYSLAR